MRLYPVAIEAKEVSAGVGRATSSSWRMARNEPIRVALGDAAGQARNVFNLAIDSKLRGCDVVAIRVEDVAAGGYTADRATVRQKKTGRPVRFELSEQTRQAIDDYLKAANKRCGEFLFMGRRGSETNMTTRQYARHVSKWIGSAGLDPRLFGTHSLRRTKATLIYRRAEGCADLSSNSAVRPDRHSAVPRRPSSCYRT